MGKIGTADLFDEDSGAQNSLTLSTSRVQYYIFSPGQSSEDSGGSYESGVSETKVGNGNP